MLLESVEPRQLTARSSVPTRLGRGIELRSRRSRILRSDAIALRRQALVWLLSGTVRPYLPSTGGKAIALDDQALRKQRNGGHPAER